MNRLTKRCMLALLTIPLLFLTAALRADEVDGLINTLKPSPMDYAVWAQRLLETAEGLGANPKAQARLYEAAYEYGLKKAKGYRTAIKAAQGLLKAKPNEKLAWQRKLLAALKLDWRAADRNRKTEAGKAYVDRMIAVADGLAASGNAAEAVKLYRAASSEVRHYAPYRTVGIARKLKDIKEQQKVRQQLAQCKRLLSANPKNAAVRGMLIRLYVVELDEVAEARKLLTADVSEEMRTYVPMAAMKVEEAAKEVCLELGDWYVSLAAKATLRAKAKALTRAKAYYERFVSLETDPMKALVGKTKLATVEKGFRRLAETLNPKMPKHAVSFSGHYYKLFRGTHTWHEARKACQQMGGHLACVSDAKENRFLALLCGDVESAWLGGTDENAEGRWEWVNGEPFKYTNWSGLEPNNHMGIEHYLDIRSSSHPVRTARGTWNDVRADEKAKGFLSEWE